MNCKGGDMNKNVCNICGANYEYVDGKWKCPSCGAYKEEELSNEEVTLLYNAAQKLRLNAFDDAEEMYRDVVRRYPKCSEGYWGLVLSKYGIKYEQDYDGKMIPTCYAASYESVLNDKNYGRALELSNDDNRRYYEEQAEKIEKIRKEWVEKASKEQPYDIFISYKDTELENGVSRTNDSYDAFELYTHLRSQGYNVFFSRESLKGKEGERYEPYIFNALNTAHVMIVFGSKLEYIESTWIKNEWSRFYKRIKNGQKQSNALIVVYKDFNPSGLPRPLNSVQSLDRNALTFISDLDAYIARVVGAAKVALPRIERVEIKASAKGGKAAKGKEKKKSAEVRPGVEKRELGGIQIQKLTANAEKRLAVADAYLQGEQYDEAEKAFSDFLVSDKNNGKALVGKLLSKAHCKSVDDITSDSLSDFDDWDLLDRVLHCAEKGDAEKILKAFCALSIACLHSDTARVKEVCEQVCAYDLACVAKLREDLLAFGLKHLSDCNEAKYFIDTAILYEQNSREYIKKLQSAISSYVQNGKYVYADECAKKLADADESSYIECCISVAEAARKARKFGVAKEYYEKALEFVPDNATALFGKVCASISCESDDRLYAHIQGLSEFSDVEDWLAVMAETDYVPQLEVLLAACEKHITERGTERDNIGDVAQRLLAYIPKNDDEKLVLWLKRLATAFQENNDFDMAQKFFSMAIAVDSEDHATYWGLLQSKLNCKTDEEVIEQPTPLSDYQEFQNALVAAGSNRDAMAHYIDVQGKQKEWAAKKAKKDKATKRRKKITVITSIVMAVVLMIVGAIVGGVSYYNSENQLKFIAVNGGYAVYGGKYYHKNASGKLVIPTEHDGKPVVEIADNAFENFDKVNEIVLPSTIVRIGGRAFAGTAITEITLSPTIEYIGKNVFYGCNSLNVIHIPDRTELPSKWNAEWSGGSNAKIEFQIKVIYDYNGATANNTVTSTYVVYENDFNLIVPVRDGYAFNGWYRGEQKLTDSAGKSISAWNFSDGGTVQAHWSANDNKIIFNGNGATSGEMPEQTIKTDDSETLLQNQFVRRGYTFAGWATSADGSKVYSDKAVYVMGVKSSYTLYAVWEANDNTIVFDGNGNTSGSMSEQTIKTDASANLNANAFERTGYDFVGWSTVRNGEKVYSDKARYTMGTESSYTLYAIWAPKTYKITLHLAGGVGANGNPETYTIESNKIEIKNPTRAGYTFAGWTSDSFSGAQMKVEITTGSVGDRTYTATWTANINTVTFHANGGEGEMQKQEIATDGTANLTSNVFTRRGYEFIGWATSESGQKVYNNNASYTMGVNANYDLYAVWSIITYRINYVLDGGNVSGNPDSFTVDSKEIELKNPTRAGYEFTGWTSEVLSGLQMHVTIESGSIGTREYTAHWTPNINTIKFHANGGDGEMQDQKLATDATDNLSQCRFTRKGYAFVGWSIIPNGAKVYDDIASYTMGKEPEYNLYAVWQIETYTITYHLEGGSATGNLQSYNVNTAEFELHNPTRRGYEFTGWSGTGIDGKSMSVKVESGSTGPRTYTAHWDIIEYTITYKYNGGSEEDNVTTYTVEDNDIYVKNPSKTGYNFVGWSGTGIVGTTDRLVIPKGSIDNRDYEAVFEAKQYTITFKPNGGKCDVSKMTVTYDKSFVLPEAKRFAYDFLGWYESDSRYDSGIWQYDGNITLTAQWQKQEIIELYTAEDLAQVVYELSANYILQADIDLQNAEWNIIGDKSNPFTGTFDGNHHTVSNFKISKTADYIGFFGANSGTIKNLRLTGANITSGILGAGILVGYNTGRIEECMVQGNINCRAASVGGMIGIVYGASYLSNSQALIDIHSSSTASLYIGGLIGTANKNNDNIVDINQCSVSGTISGESIRYESGGWVCAGGLVGTGYVQIHNCSFIGNIKVNVSSRESGNSRCQSNGYAGGLLGRGSGYIENSFAITSIGGKIYSYSGNNYAYATIYAGGILGYGYAETTLINCFAHVVEYTIALDASSGYAFAGFHEENYFGGLSGNVSAEINLTNCYHPSDDFSNVEGGISTSATNFKSPNFIKEILEWSDTIWSLENGEYPKLYLYEWEE